MSKILISICIPTFNGSISISKTLDSIIYNIQKANNAEKEVEIVLTDDCSSDNTLNIINEYAFKYSYIKVFQNTKNLGMDGNFKRVAVNATGEYIWYSGQDDIFLDGSIEHVLNSIKKHHDLGLVSINYSQYSEEDKEYVCESMFHLQAFHPKEIDFNHDLLFNNAKEYFSFFKDAPSFLPAIIMKRAFMINTYTDEYLETYFIQYAVILLNVNNAKILAVTRPLINGFVPKSGWHTNGNKLFSYQLGRIKASQLVFNDVRNPFPKKIFYFQKIFYLRHFLRIVVASSYYGFKFSINNKKDLEFVYGGVLYYLYFFPATIFVSLIPHNFIIFLFKIKKKILKYNK